MNLCVLMCLVVNFLLLHKFVAHPSPRGDGVRHEARRLPVGFSIYRKNLAPFLKNDKNTTHDAYISLLRGHANFQLHI